MHIEQYINIGYGLHKFTSEELKPIWDEIMTLDQNWATPNGLINHKSPLVDCVSHVERLVGEQIVEFNRVNNWPNQLRVIDRPTPLKLTGLWVNWMSRHEFSPIHKHEAVISFVIWLTVPYTLESEIAARPYVPEHFNFGGQFALHYTDSLGQVCTQNLPVYTDWESTLCMFPAGVKHSVFPFYSSNQLRVSVAGNFTFDPSA